ncbi:MAG: S46 family peptidase [Bacteroidales bacterium]|nr:S46 family peptidase [Bacteroidales bacterium]
MKKITLVILTLLSVFTFQSRADEGMWLPLFVQRLNYVDMQKEGLHLTAEEIYSINHSSLKDAIIIFGGGCTGEIVSPNGLIFTNHHCGYSSIQSHSTVDHDYLSDGFWATRYEEELPTPGLRASFLVSIQDVTAAALAGVTNQMTEAERADKIKENSKKIESENTKGTQYEARTTPFFNGNEYYLFLYEVYKDVRLVGAPPTSIGKFGADTDNWMWPRHTGDFSVFRVYASKDNKPAEYAAGNVPMKSKQFLPVSIKEKKIGDFAMIMGYPGRTTRYATSTAIKFALEKNNPMVVKIRTKKLDILREDMAADASVRIKYAAKFAGSANYWKYYIGQSKGLKQLGVYDRKKELEDQFANWINTDKDRSAIYSEALPDISLAYETINKYEAAVRYNAEAIMQGCEIIAFSRNFNKLADVLAKPKPDQKIVQTLTKQVTEASGKYFKDYNMATDVKMLAAMLQLYYNDVPKEMQPAYLEKIHKKYKGDFAAYASEVFSKTNFSDTTKVKLFLSNPQSKSLQKDPAWILYKAFSANSSLIDSLVKPSNELLAKGNRLFMQGLREMQSDRTFYPDANFTMRLTYGQVLDYSPADAIDYNYVTTLDGVMAKEDPSNPEFVVADKLKQLYKAKDYGRYGENGKMVVGFLTNNDITGGNSGSPVLNGDGELIGLAFDGNWEAMSGNYAFEPKLQRTICVDIRYVLFVIDKYAGATNLINELDIRN